MKRITPLILKKKKRWILETGFKWGRYLSHDHKKMIFVFNKLIIQIKQGVNAPFTHL